MAVARLMSFAQITCRPILSKHLKEGSHEKMILRVWARLVSLADLLSMHIRP